MQRWLVLEIPYEAYRPVRVIGIYSDEHRAAQEADYTDYYSQAHRQLIDLQEHIEP